MQRWIVTALGQDRPGIVAGVTKVLYRLGCNLEDAAMKRLEGEFAIMLIFSSAHGPSDTILRRRFEPLQRRLKLVIHLKALTKREAAAPRKRGRACLISVYGADRRGIVFRISEALAHRGINITDVHAHRSAGGGRRAGPSLYLVLLEVEVQPPRTVAGMEAHLKRVAKELGVEVSVRLSEADVL